MLELFDPHPLPQPGTWSAHRQVVDWQPGRALPWESLAPPQPDGATRHVWRHAVHLGVYRLEDAYLRLRAVFGEDPEAAEEPPEGESACAGLLLDHKGRIVPGSAVLSSALWALTRVRPTGHNDPRWPEEFPKAQQDFITSVDGFNRPRRASSSMDKASAPAPAQDAASLLELLRIAQDSAGVGGIPEFSGKGVRITSMAVPARQAGDGSGAGLLNSPYLDDLSAVRRHMVVRGTLAPAVAGYLTEDGALDPQRIDVAASPQVVEAGVTIEQIPAGRWPSDPAQAPTLSAQFAVDKARNDLGVSPGLMGVNAVPGADTTALLRDVLASNLVERARRLAQLPHPREAFTPTTHTWTADDGTPRRVRVIRPELTGFEMVFACPDDAAARGLSVEFTGREALDEQWRKQADYFADLAATTLPEPDDELPYPREAWGLVAPYLGDRNNRAGFWSRFWGRGDRHRPGADDMMARLSRWEDGEIDERHWDEAREVFSRAEHRVAVLLHKRRQAQQRLRELPQAVLQVKELRESASQVDEQLRLRKHDLGRHQATKERAEARLAQAQARHARHLEEKPRVSEVLSSLGRSMRDWKAEQDTLDADLREAEARYEDLLEEDRHLRGHVGKLRSQANAVAADCAEAEEKLSMLRERCAQDKERHGPGYPDEQWVGEQRASHAPWVDAELNQARSELFLAAFRLHEDFLAHTAGDMIDALRAAGDVLTGTHPHSLPAEKLTAAWQSFFLVVPAISTALDSIPRLFGKAGPEAIGWLVLHDAGGVAPQCAAGAIWRAQRAIVVGDPLCQHPAVPIPEAAVRDIAAAFDVSPTWIPPQASAQTLADRVSYHGMTRLYEDRPVWVGVPLH